MKITCVAPFLAAVLSLAAQQAAANPLPQQHAERAAQNSALSLWQLADY